MTLFIAGGANDVALMQEANTGCKVFGFEGSQASMPADYAFGQFCSLTELLPVHSRSAYAPVGDMHATYFYKVRSLIAAIAKSVLILH
jgi:phospholipid-translocating ATPase